MALHFTTLSKKVMVTSPYEWKILEWDENQTKNNKNV